MRKFSKNHEHEKGLHSDFQAFVNKGITNAIKQIESYIAIEHYLNTGQLIPEFHGWPISPDLGVLLIKTIEASQYDLIVEFGSGTSTWLIGQVQKNNKFQHLAFDHITEYWQKTKNQLESVGLKDIDLRLRPLKPYQSSNNQQYQYYDCSADLAEYAINFNQVGKRLLILVDGPPAATGRHARYPALPFILNHFPDADIDFILDDFIRQDEQQILKLWLEELTVASVPHNYQIFRLEKDACLLTISNTTIN